MMSKRLGRARRSQLGVSELRIDYLPGYRVYYMQRGAVLALLLCGGDKRTPDADIKRAFEIRKGLDTHGEIDDTGLTYARLQAAAA
jgi:putative addiction module killer protein